MTPEIPEIPRVLMLEIQQASAASSSDKHGSIEKRCRKAANADSPVSACAGEHSSVFPHV